jgi:hypothetical protein
MRGNDEDGFHSWAFEFVECEKQSEQIFAHGIHGKARNLEVESQKSDIHYSLSVSFRVFRGKKFRNKDYAHGIHGIARKTEV